MQRLSFGLIPALLLGLLTTSCIGSAVVASTKASPRSSANAPNVAVVGTATLSPTPSAQAVAKELRASGFGVRAVPDGIGYELVAVDKTAEGGVVVGSGWAGFSGAARRGQLEPSVGPCPSEAEAVIAYLGNGTYVEYFNHAQGLSGCLASSPGAASAFVSAMRRVIATSG